MQRDKYIAALSHRVPRSPARRFQCQAQVVVEEPRTFQLGCCPYKVYSGRSLIRRRNLGNDRSPDAHAIVMTQRNLLRSCR